MTSKFRSRYRLQAGKYLIYVGFRMNQNGCADVVEYQGNGTVIGDWIMDSILLKMRSGLGNDK